MFALIASIIIGLSASLIPVTSAPHVKLANSMVPTVAVSVTSVPSTTALHYDTVITRGAVTLKADVECDREGFQTGDFYLVGFSARLVYLVPKARLDILLNTMGQKEAMLKIADESVICLVSMTEKTTI